MSGQDPDFGIEAVALIVFTGLVFWGLCELGSWLFA